MYGLSKDINLSFLLERELEQVCIGLYQVILHFDKETSITLECQFSHYLDFKVLSVSQDLPESESSLIKPLGCKIVGTENLGDGNLAITFPDGTSPKHFDSNESTESYQISHHGKDEIIA